MFATSLRDSLKQNQIKYIYVYYSKAKNWISLFTSIDRECQGHHNKNITPYMHAMVYHVPKFMKKKTHNGIKNLQGKVWQTE